MEKSKNDTQTKISAGRQKKIDIVANLNEKLDKAKSIYFVDFKGVTHKQLEELRKILIKTQAEFKVIKNRLLSRALGAKAQDASEFLKNSTGVLFSYGDEIIPLKDLTAFFKSINTGSAKGGFMGSNRFNADEVNKLALMPPKNVLLSQLAGQLNAPISGLHYALSWNLNRLVWALNGIRNKKR